MVWCKRTYGLAFMFFPGSCVHTERQCHAKTICGPNMCMIYSPTRILSSNFHPMLQNPGTVFLGVSLVEKGENKRGESFQIIFFGFCSIPHTHKGKKIKTEGRQLIHCFATLIRFAESYKAGSTIVILSHLSFLDKVQLQQTIPSFADGSE